VIAGLHFLNLFLFLKRDVGSRRAHTRLPKLEASAVPAASPAQTAKFFGKLKGKTKGGERAGHLEESRPVNVAGRPSF
jgi:hypothetical protein